MDQLQRIKPRIVPEHPTNNKIQEMLKSVAEKIAITEHLDVQRKQSVQKEDDHKLEVLWSLYLSGFKYQRVTNEWQKMGFQGNDPATDFRSAGMLGLDWLLYFAEVHPKEARDCLEIANKPDNFFYFAVTGIHAVIWTLDFLKSGRFDTFLIETEYTTIPEELFCELMLRFT